MAGDPPNLIRVMPAKGEMVDIDTSRDRSLASGGTSPLTPIPSEDRRFGALDLMVLWGDLSLGLLVIVTGALLVVLGMSLPQALLAIVIGSAIGCVPLALVGMAGTREGLPGMVLFRPVLGVRGSFIPSALNLAQLLGWTAFELWAMALVANEVSKDLFGLDSYVMWLAVVAILGTTLALGGPVLVVRAWLERFAVYVAVGVGLWLTYEVLTVTDLGALWSRPAGGGLPFWLGVDLVIAMPLSWLPLVADYNRFGRTSARSFAGTYWGYFAGNVWFYSLGALLVLSVGAAADVPGIGSAIAGLAGGALVLVVLLVGESDQAFANLYSAAVTVRNVVPRAPQRWLVVGIAAVAFGLAWALSMAAYEFFLFLIGSVFVPLFGVFAADYFIKRRGRFGPQAVERSLPGVRWRALAPWAAGFLLYQWSAPTELGWWKSAMSTVFADWLRLPFPLWGSRLGASIPGFAVAFLLALLILPRPAGPVSPPAREENPAGVP